MPHGLALPFLPYILYILINKDSLSKKHYIGLFLIGLNSSLIQDIFSFVFLIPLSFILNHKKKNLKIYSQVFSVVFISSLISCAHLVIGSILSDPIHREAWNPGNNMIFPFAKTFVDFFTYGDPESSLFIFNNPLVIFTSFIGISAKIIEGQYKL